MRQNYQDRFLNITLSCKKKRNDLFKGDFLLTRMLSKPKCPSIITNDKITIR